MRVLVHGSKMLMYDAARNMQRQSWELFVVEFQPSNGKWRVDVATAKSVPQRNTKQAEGVPPKSPPVAED